MKTAEKEKPVANSRRPKVHVLSSSPNPLLTVYLAIRECKAAEPASRIEPASEDEMTALVRKVVFKHGHTSVAEHGCITFAVEGISRVCSHQLVRHRIGCSYSQKSDRAREIDGDPYVEPPASIQGDPQMRASYNALLERAAQVYGELRELGARKEDARFVLPQALNTSLVVTMTWRALLHFLDERLSPAAQWEIREVANQMAALAAARFPALFDEKWRITL
jgi:thymidylate synthase (FAD)